MLLISIDGDNGEPPGAIRRSVTAIGWIREREGGRRREPGGGTAPRRSGFPAGRWAGARAEAGNRPRPTVGTSPALSCRRPRSWQTPWREVGRSCGNAAARRAVQSDPCSILDGLRTVSTWDRATTLRIRTT